MTKKSIDHLTIEGEDAERYSMALADVLCWFQGFKAARPKASLPSSIDELRNLNIKLKSIPWPGSD